MAQNKRTAEDAKEDFRQVYKDFIIKTKGEWTEKDAEELERQITNIDKNALWVACVIGCLIYALIIVISYFSFRWLGWI